MTDCSVDGTRMGILLTHFSAVSSASDFSFIHFSVALQLQAIKSSSKHKCVEFMHRRSIDAWHANCYVASFRFYISISIALVSMHQTNSKIFFFPPHISHSRCRDHKNKISKIIVDSNKQQTHSFSFACKFQTISNT